MKISENVGIEQIIESVFDFFSLSHNMSFFNINNIQVCNEIEGEFDAQVIRDGCLRPEDLVVQIEYDKKSIGQREYTYNLYVRLLHELTHVYDFKLLYDKYNTVCEHPYQIAYDMWSEFNAWTYSEVTMLNKYNEQIDPELLNRYLLNHDAVCDNIKKNINSTMDAYSFLYKTIILYSHCYIKDQFLNVKVDKSCYYKVSKDFFDTGIEPILDDIYDLLVSHMENTDILKNNNLEYFYDLINEFFLEY